ncbi:MAG: signal peptidase I [Chloroflexia bacterium]|nr:signal peptidase I [Chloroflexia bacterium]
MTEREDFAGRSATPPRDFPAYGFESPATTTRELPAAHVAPEHQVVEGATTVQREKGRPSAFREIVETLLLAVIIFFAVRAVVLNFRVEGLSMSPNLHNGEMLLVNRNAYNSFDLYALVDWLPGVAHDESRTVQPFDPPERGDIVVFDPPTNSDKPYIKRVIGLPGESVEIRNGSVFIDGQEVNEPYLDGESTECPGRDACEPVTVPPDQIFVLGDNRDNSQDSRSFGPVEVDDIIGKAWVTYWPSADIGIVPHYDYPEIAEK